MANASGIVNSRPSVAATWAINAGARLGWRVVVSVAKSVPWVDSAVV